eukprot:TRINITY_DN5402_c0_g2_i2.p1 TRINITY_DN5402_c0_g2~~TRINITY_DN5402_c0_g2_i2.p1  ORF type:complete len:186 (+),score=36.24 TRINITY_DN5402_c0_g2_i2:27-584(+)
MTVFCASFIEGGGDITIHKNIAESESSNQMAFGRFHYSGKHCYTIKINKRGYSGLGVGSKDMVDPKQFSTEALHKTTGCSVYYYTGCWYGYKKKSNRFAQAIAFNANEKIKVYFDVETGKVKYVRGTEVLANCKVNQGHAIEKGLRLGVVLGSSSQISIVDYRPVDCFPEGKMTTGHQLYKNTQC